MADRLVPTNISIEDWGSVILVTPLTDEARTWLDQHTASDAMWWSGSLVVEPRYIAPLLEGLIAEGLWSV